MLGRDLKSLDMRELNEIKCVDNVDFLIVNGP